MMERKTLTARNPVIDIFRGVAVLNVLFIHTAFYSGEFYVPEWVRNLSLWIDIPFFLFLSGWGSGMRSMGDVIRSAKGLWKNVFCKGIFFAIVTALVYGLPGLPWINSGQEFLRAFALVFTYEKMPVLADSVWFLTYYLRAVFFNQLLIGILKPYAEKKGYEEAQIVGFLLGCNLVLFMTGCAGAGYLPLELTQKDFLYNSFWLLGALVAKKQIRISSVKALIFWLLVNGAAFFGISAALSIDLTSLQSVKFPKEAMPMAAWLFYSLFSVITALWLQTKLSGRSIPEKGLTHIGRTAMYYFFAQGISSALLGTHSGGAIEQWWILFGIRLVCNVVIAMLIAEGVAFCEKICGKLWKRFEGSKIALQIKEMLLKSLGLDT